MKKILFILMLIPMLVGSQINPSTIKELATKYAPFVTVEDEKTVEYKIIATYIDGRKSNVTIINAYTPFSIIAPELGIEYLAPPLEPLRLINGTLWSGSKSSRVTNVASFEILSENWYISGEYVEPNIVPTILDFVNHPSVTEQELDAISYVRTSSAQTIVATRPLTLEQLDAIPWVGTNTLKNLTDYAKTWVNPDAVDRPAVTDNWKTRFSPVSIDDDVNTFWLNRRTGVADITFNFEDEFYIRNVTYLPRQDDSNEGDVKRYTILKSEDYVTWEVVGSGVLENSKSLKTIPVNVTTQYLNFRLDSYHEGEYANIAEININ